MKSQALFSRLNQRKAVIFEAACLSLSVILLSLVAQITIPLPGTPVPITGQTFGVILIALLSGSVRSGAAIGVYLAVGMAGAPVFADAGSGPDVGPAFGYLLGMFVAGIAIGYLADKGAATTFAKALSAALLGTVIIFVCGVAGLSFFLSTDALLATGVLPFLPGATVKCVLAAGIARWLDSRFPASRERQSAAMR